MSTSDEMQNEKEYSEETGDSKLTPEEKVSLCRAFTLLDTDGDGVIKLEDLQQLLISWGRLPMDDEWDIIMSYTKGTTFDGAKGMDFEGFQKYIEDQLKDTKDENALREAFAVFDSDPPTGQINMTELRHFLKHKQLKLTDDEIDFLFREEDYWMLEENMFEYEQLISKILDKPTCDSPFLNCWKQDQESEQDEESEQGEPSEQSPQSQK